MTAHRSPTDYTLSLPPLAGDDFVRRVFALVWRHDVDAPGFCVLDAGPAD